MITVPQGEIRYSPKNPPESIEVAQATIEELTHAIHEINIDLGHRKQTHQETADEFKSWRVRALIAQGHITRELQFLKRWVLHERSRYRAKNIGTDFDNPKTLVHAAFVALRSIKDRKVELTREEKVLFDLLDHHLKHK